MKKCTKKDGINVILADCEFMEVEDFQKGVGNALGEPVTTQSYINNRFGKNKRLSDIKRYFRYFSVPLNVFFHRKRYKRIIGWQQFYALVYCWFCSVFHVKKRNEVIAANFTYKEKTGLKGKIYFRFMKRCIMGGYLDYLHVPSEGYKQKLLSIFPISPDRVVVLPFGVPDDFEEWKDSSVEYKNYVLSIGRSNRDFAWLVDEWKRIKKYQLLIISDVFSAPVDLPENVHVIRTYDQYPFIMNSKFVIIPLKDGNLCSGDTVLLRAMSFKKMVIVSKPSTLAEMYIQDGQNGVCVSKETGGLSGFINTLQDEEILRIGENARESYLKNYSRYAMGYRLGCGILQKSSE